MKPSLLARVAGQSLLALALAASLPADPGSTPAVTLGTFVVSASRTPQDPLLLPSDVALLPLDELQAAQVPDLRTALAAVPGVIVANSGAVGSPSAVFLRGANSNQTLFVVDGVRLNTSNASYGNFLGAVDLAGLDRIEVLRGPQSTLYGSSAMGGVILLETTRGCGTPITTASASAGSFGSFGAGIATQGGTTDTGYSVSLTRTQTDNDRDYNRYKNWSYSTRVETKPTSSLLVGATMRGFVGHFEEPGSTLSPYPGDVQSSTHLVTAYGEASAGEAFTSRLTVAWYQDEYHWNKGDPYGYYSRNTRQIADWQNTWMAAPGAEIVAGVDAEWSAYQSGGIVTDRSLAEYVSATLRPSTRVEVIAGLRHDDFSAEGSAVTGRFGVAWRLNESGTKLRATYGTGFNAPTPASRYGSPPYVLPNPNLRPEKSRGWDAGIDQKLLDGAVTLGATYFENRFSDLLEYLIVDPITFAGQEVNIGRATTRGGELSVNATLSPVLSARIAYTYLDAQDNDSHQRLIRRPRHTLDADLEAHLTKAWLAGAGVHAVADRVDGIYSPTAQPGYTTVRLHTSYAVNPNLLVKVRVENLFNRAYEEVAGYPALPRGTYLGVEWKF